MLHCLHGQRNVLGSLQRQQLIHLLEAFIADSLLPIDPKRVPACIDGGLKLPLIKKGVYPLCSQTTTFLPSPEEQRVIRVEVQKLLDRGIIRASLSPWTAQCFL